MFPLSLVTPGTTGHGYHPWGVRMRRDPRLQQRRELLQSSCSLERCAKARQREHHPLGLCTTSGHGNMLINTEKHVRGEISFLVVGKPQKESDLAPCKHDAVFDTLRACFWGYGPF